MAKFMTVTYKNIPHYNGANHYETIQANINDLGGVTVSIDSFTRTGKQMNSNLAFLSIEEAEGFLKQLQRQIEFAKKK